LKPGRLYLHVFDRPKDGVLLVPSFGATMKSANFLGHWKNLKATQQDNDLRIILPAQLPDARDSVVVVNFTGALTDSWQSTPEIISRQFDSFSVDAAKAHVAGNAVLKSETSSQYFGNWKHDTCVENLQAPTDRAEFSFRFLEPGDYRVTLEYACSAADASRVGVVEIGGQSLGFQSLLTGEVASHDPLLFIRHHIGVVSIKTPGVVPVAVHPKNDGAGLLWLRRIIVEPVK
jgi:alpha-L-fucosidase